MNAYTMTIPRARLPRSLYNLNWFTQRVFVQRLRSDNYPTSLASGLFKVREETRRRGGRPAGGTGV